LGNKNDVYVQAYTVESGTKPGKKGYEPPAPTTVIQDTTSLKIPFRMKIPQKGITTNNYVILF